jgi:hypothetical protein
MRHVRERLPKLPGWRSEFPVAPAFHIAFACQWVNAATQFQRDDSARPNQARQRFSARARRNTITISWRLQAIAPRVIAQRRS